LHEYLGLLGKIGCAICLIGSVIIVLHAPPDKDVDSVDEILHLAIQPGTHSGILKDILLSAVLILIPGT
jgi:hypothetical protein